MSLRLAQPLRGFEPIIEEHAPLRKHTWFKVGGPARYLARPRNVDELRELVHRCAQESLKVYVLGRGANVLIRDEGIDGVVIKLEGDAFERVEHDKSNATLKCAAGVDLAKLILRCVREGLGGLDPLAGIPATIGGAVRMNAGGRFGDIGAVVERVTVMDGSGQVFVREKEDLIFGYRSTNIVAPFILDATLQMEPENPDEVMRRYKQVFMYKQNTQPLNAKSAGCMFKNPGGPMSAGALIDKAGLKGTRLGRAEVSDRHANFLIAHPDCSADDIIRLMKLVKEKVAETHGVDLQTEVQIWPDDRHAMTDGPRSTPPALPD